MGVQKVMLCAFQCKPRPSEVSLESPGLENIPQVPGNGAKVVQDHDARKAVSATVSVLSEVGLYFGPLHFKTEKGAETALRASLF